MSALSDSRHTAPSALPGTLAHLPALALQAARALLLPLPAEAGRGLFVARAVAHLVWRGIERSMIRTRRGVSEQGAAYTGETARRRGTAARGIGWRSADIPRRARRAARHRGRLAPFPDSRGRRRARGGALRARERATALTEGRVLSSLDWARENCGDAEAPATRSRRRRSRNIWRQSNRSPLRICSYELGPEARFVLVGSQSSVVEVSLLAPPARSPSRDAVAARACGAGRRTAQRLPGSLARSGSWPPPPAAAPYRCGGQTPDRRSHGPSAACSLAPPRVTCR